MDLKSSFREILEPVTTNLGFKVTTQDFSGRCSDIRLNTGVIELYLFDDIMDKATVKIRFANKDHAEEDYAIVLNKLLGSDFGLTEYLGGWNEEGLLPANLEKALGVIAETLPSVLRKYNE